MTPLAPLDPYIAAADASLSTVILSISAALINERGLRPPATPLSSRGTPSTTKSGLELADKEV